MYIDKQKFLIKAALIGALSTTMGTYHFENLENVSINVPIWLSVRIFTEYFEIILLFWLAFSDNLPKNWILAGTIGSLFYTLAFGILRGWGYFSLSPSELSPMLHITQGILIGAFSAIPNWMVLRGKFSKSHLWIAINAVGFAFVLLTPGIISYIITLELINKAVFFSFLTLQLYPDGMQLLSRILYGLLLGQALYVIIKSPISTAKFNKSIDEII